MECNMKVLLIGLNFIEKCDYYLYIIINYIYFEIGEFNKIGIMYA